jgi:hypothetical protein
MEVHCGSTLCGQLLGEVTTSTLGQGDQPVWKIAPGWFWNRDHVLEFGDTSFRSERSLLEKTVGRQRLVEGVGISREVRLDAAICVKCPKCHRTRWIPPDLYLRARSGISARQPVLV